jgi:AraC family transcriptional activator FtrA
MQIAKKSSSSAPLIAALAYDQLCTFEFGCVVELFALSRPELNVDWYRFGVCSYERGPLRATGGVTLTAPFTLSLLDRAQTIIIPGWRDPDERPPEILLKKLRAAHRRGARICSICSGVFVLAWAGLLDGRRATTHWRLAERLGANFPDITVEANALYIEDGPFMTSAGSASGIDMMLHMVRQDHGARAANLVAQRLIVPPHRDGGQAQFVPRPMPNDDHGRLSRLMAWIKKHPGEQHTLASLAAMSSMSARTLQRQFQESTGLSPYDWIVRERVQLAKELLEHTGLALEVVCERAGFGSGESFRRHFRRIAQTTPAAYRRSFHTS